MSVDRGLAWLGPVGLCRRASVGRQAQKRGSRHMRYGSSAARHNLASNGEEGFTLAIGLRSLIVPPQPSEQYIERGDPVTVS